MVTEIFCCYAREDENLLRDFKYHISSLEHVGIVKIWDDTNISAGTEWEREIEKHLNTAHIILLFISPYFMASKYCYSKEMKQAIDRHERGEVRVIPIILRHTFWEIETFRKLKVLPPDGKAVGDADKHTQDKAFKKVVEGIYRVVKELNTKTSATSEITSLITASSKQSNPQDQPILTRDTDITENKGSLVIYAKGNMRGKTIDLYPGFNKELDLKNPFSSTFVENTINGKTVFRAIFPSLKPGNYTASSGIRYYSRVTISAGQTCEIDWR